MSEKSHKIPSIYRQSNIPDISFIIPVYNTALYLRNCIDSIIEQHLLSYEIIIVNDGSTDNSADIINNYVSHFTYIHVISQKNQGLSVARNVGMAHAIGNYIMFVDSDDQLEPDTMTELLYLSKSSSTDIIIGRVRSIYDDGHSVLWGIDMRDKKTMTGSEYLYFITQYACYVPMVFNYLFKREFIVSNALFFYPGIIHEDELWTPLALLKARTVSLGCKIHYNYIQRKNSIMDTLHSERRADSLIIIIRELLREYVNVDSESQRLGAKFLELHIMNLFEVCLSCCGEARGYRVGQILGEIIYEFKKSNQQINLMPIIKKYIRHINLVQHSSQ